ncbi:30S ribosomal protein S9 [Patescibacteria group bacterium]|nr:30S ribosomal protein S9 [Patescibacteria group bacterium]MCG2694569.1 30S ribosomal protein S9 [Candidatus Parcubacteria bacterium]
MIEKKSKDKYFEAVGRRKTSVARVRITEAKATSFSVNDKKLEEYFNTKELQAVANDALKKSEVGSKFFVSAILKGGGVSGQADALRHGISRALLKFDEEATKRKLKKAGFLKRDPRMKERKKPGLKKARKAPQWSKR